MRENIELNTNDSLSFSDEFQKLLQNQPEEALDFALQHKRLDWIKKATESGADINAVTRDYTRLYRAVYSGNREVVELLVQCAADVNVADKNGCKAVHLATGHPEIMKFLLEKTPNFSIENNEHLLKEIGQNITPETMKLFSVITKRKKNNKYNFMQTVIKMEQIDEFLLILKSSDKPVSEIFSIRDYSGFIPHWFCAKIEIKNNEIKLLILNSTGWQDCRWNGTMAQLTNNSPFAQIKTSS